MIILGIDPATGASSPTGLAVIEPRARVIHRTEEVTTRQDATEHHKLASLAKQVLNMSQQHGAGVVACETFVMMGKSGQLLQRLIGAYISNIPTDKHYEEVHNITMKKLVAGAGTSDKLDVALGCLFFFRSNENASAYIRALIADQSWDRLDAIGIALAAYIQMAYTSGNSDDILLARQHESESKRAFIDLERALSGVPRKIAKKRA